MKKVDIRKAAEIGLKILGNNNIFTDDLGFRLRLTSNHHYLNKRNIKPSTIKHFDIGYCASGYLKGRIAISIHANNGTLVGYAGRTIDDNSQPKYLFPPNFKKLDYLYNFHRVINVYNDQRRPICVVEGFFDVFHLYQNELLAVSIMGCTMSNKQLKLLKSLDALYYLIMDGDKAGHIATKKISKFFQSAGLKFKPIYLTDNMQPEFLPKNYLSTLTT